jgi:hypothetical protein
VSVFDFRPLVAAFNMAAGVSITAWRYDPSAATYVDGELAPNAVLYVPIVIPNGQHTFVPAPKDYVDRLPEGERQRSRKLVWMTGDVTLRTIRAATYAKPDLVRDEQTGDVYEAEDEWPHGRQAGICGVVLVKIDDAVSLPRAV